MKSKTLYLATSDRGNVIEPKPLYTLYFRHRVVMLVETLNECIPILERLIRKKGRLSLLECEVFLPTVMECRHLSIKTLDEVDLFDNEGVFKIYSICPSPDFRTHVNNDPIYYELFAPDPRLEDESDEF